MFLRIPSEDLFERIEWIIIHKWICLKWSYHLHFHVDYSVFNCPRLLAVIFSFWSSCQHTKHISVQHYLLSEMVLCTNSLGEEDLGGGRVVDFLCHDFLSYWLRDKTFIHYSHQERLRLVLAARKKLVSIHNSISKREKTPLKCRKWNVPHLVSWLHHSPSSPPSIELHNVK